MAFHCGAPTRDGSACQRHVREPGTRCSQHRNLGGPALRPPRHAMRTIALADPALIEAPTAWSSTRDRVKWGAGEESEAAEAGSLGDGEVVATADGGTAVGAAAEARADRPAGGGAVAAAAAEAQADKPAGDGAVAVAPVDRRPELEAEAEAVVEARPGTDADPPARPDPEVDPEVRPGSVAKLDFQPAREAEAEGAATEAESAKPVGLLSYLDRDSDRAERNGRPEPEPDAQDEPGPLVESEARPAEQRPLLRKERALDPDWIGARPLFRDEAPTRPMPRIEFEPSEGAEAGALRKPPRIAPLRSVVLNPHSDEASQAPVKPVLAPGSAPAPDDDPPTLIDRMPPIDPDDLVVPDFLRPGFAEPARPPETKPPLKRRPVRAPEPKTEPQAKTQPVPDPDPPTLIDPQPTAAPDDISVPDFIVPGFTEPAPKPPLRTVLSTVLGPDLWQRCYTEWSAAHCTALARIARSVDGLAPSAGTAVRSTAEAGMRWLGVAREREMLADQVAAAISHPAGATAANQARTVRLYGAAICVALNLPLRRCACHRDLERDVSGELIRLGLEELAGEVP